MKSVFVYNGKEYTSVTELRRAMPNVSIPETPPEDDLVMLGVTLREVSEVMAAPTLAELKEAKKAEIAAARDVSARGGIIFDGMRISTDSEDRELLIGAVIQVLIDPLLSIQWRTADGLVDLTSGQIKAISGAVQHHIQAGFRKEADLIKRIDDAKNAEELAEIVWQ